MLTASAQKIEFQKREVQEPQVPAGFQGCALAYPPKGAEMTPMEAARAALKEVFGYDDFRPGQEDAVAAILRGRDVMAVMPTGAGKSICYQIPALVLPGVTLVV